MTAGLLDWMDEPAADRGVSFYDDDGTWHTHRYPELAAAVRGVAATLLDLGVRRDDRVAIVLPTQAEFVTAFFGTLRAGCTPCPLVPPSLFLAREGYVEHLGHLLAGASPSVVLTTADARPVVERGLAAAGVAARVASVESDVASDADAPTRPRSSVALLQFTSGSSGAPRGVRVTWENLETNVAMILRWLDWRGRGAATSWLPTHHDMGLIGCMLTPVVNGRDARLMRPDQFVRDPLAYIATFAGEEPSVCTAAPNFGYAYVARRVQPEALEGSDLSAWRVAIVGAERLDPGALGRFASLLEPFGFSRDAIMPAYGLAEATLCVTAKPIDTTPRTCRPDWSSLRLGDRVAVERAAPVGDPQIGNGDGWVMGCGPAIEPAVVTIHDESGDELPENHLGEIVVHGPTVADGYDDRASGTTRFDGARVVTGDAGFVVDGELYVVGRLGDRVKVRGHTHYAEDLEGRVTAIDGAPAGRCVIVPAGRDGRAGVALIVEAPPGDWIAAARAVLRRELGDEADVRIAIGPRGSIARTSSGKPRRRLIWQMLLEDRLPDDLEWDLDLGEGQADGAAEGEPAGDSRVALDSRSRASSTGNAASRNAPSRTQS